jgi:hypothetical protein
MTAKSVVFWDCHHVVKQTCTSGLKGPCVVVIMMIIIIVVGSRCKYRMMLTVEFFKTSVPFYQQNDGTQTRRQ